MLKHSCILLCLAVATMTAVSCDDYGRAKSTVSDFMAQNMKEGKPNGLSFEGVDSTRFITDSLATAMRESVVRSGIYKQGTQYAPLPLPRTLIYIQASYLQPDGRTRSRQTFYLDERQERIYCIKIDPSVSNKQANN